jgi:hypothetical protein
MRSFSWIDDDIYNDICCENRYKNIQNNANARRIEEALSSLYYSSNQYFSNQYFSNRNFSNRDFSNGPTQSNTDTELRNEIELLKSQLHALKTEMENKNEEEIIIVNKIK